MSGDMKKRLIFSMYTTSINLDMEEFKSLSIPFTGEGEQEFLGYIRDEFEWEEVFEELTPETQALAKRILGDNFSNKLLKRYFKLS